MPEGRTANAGRKVQILSTGPTAACEESPNSAESGNATTTSAEDSVVTYDLRELLEGNAAMNPYVHQGDIIIVPAAEEAIIVGNVLRPSVISLVEPTTLGRAIAIVGGTLPDSQKDKIRIKRQIAGSSGTTELLVDLKAIDKSKGDRFSAPGWRHCGSVYQDGAGERSEKDHATHAYRYALPGNPVATCPPFLTSPRM